MTTIHKMIKPVRCLILIAALVLAACGSTPSPTTSEPETQVLPSPTLQPTPSPTKEVTVGGGSLPTPTPTEVPVEITQDSSVATPEEVIETPPVSPLTTPSPTAQISRGENEGQLRVAIPDNAVIVFQRSGGFAGITEQWTFYPDGRIEESAGEQRHVEAERVQSLLTTIQNAGFFDLRDSYMPLNTCCDRFTYVITVQLDGLTKSVSTIDASPTQPEQLTAVLNGIGELLMASEQ